MLQEVVVLHRLKLAWRRTVRRIFRTHVKTTPRLKPYFEEFPWLEQLIPLEHVVSQYDVQSHFSGELIRSFKGIEVRRFDEATVTDKKEPWGRFYYVSENGEVLGWWIMSGLSVLLASTIWQKMIGKMRRIICADCMPRYVVNVIRMEFDICCIVIHKLPRVYQQALDSYLSKLIVAIERTEMSEREAEEAKARRAYEEGLDEAKRAKA